MASTPPPDPPGDPPQVAQLPTEPALPDTDEAKHLYLSAEAVRQRAKSLSEELTQAVQQIDAPLKPENEG
jgi:hypothetical protein